MVGSWEDVVRSCLYGDQREPPPSKALPLPPTKPGPQPPLPLPWPLSMRSGHVASSSSSSSSSPPSAEAMMAPPTPSFSFPLSTNHFNHGHVPSLSTTTPTANSHDGSVQPLSTTAMPETASLTSGGRTADSRYTLSGGVSRCSPADAGTCNWSALGGVSGAHGCCGRGGPFFAEEV